MGQLEGSKCAAFGRRLACVASIAAAIGLSASPVAAFDARLGWWPASNVAGYRLYVRQNGQSGGAPIDVGFPQPVSGVVYFVARGLPNGITNIFSVSAYDALGRESGRSNELSLVFGTPIATSMPTRTSTLGSGSVPPTSSGLPGATVTPRANRTATAVFTPTAIPLGKRKVRFRRASASQGATVTVPVEISAGSGVRFVTLVATFDAAVVVPGPAGLATDAGEGSVATNFSTPGTLSVSAVLQQPMTTKSVLFDVPFTAVGPCRSRTDIAITACGLDGGAIECRTSDGRIRVRCR
jgi:Cohesin domain